MTAATPITVLGIAAGVLGTGFLRAGSVGVAGAFLVLSWAMGETARRIMAALEPPAARREIEQLAWAGDCAVAVGIAWALPGATAPVFGLVLAALIAVQAATQAGVLTMRMSGRAAVTVLALGLAAW